MGADRRLDAADGRKRSQLLAGCAFSMIAADERALALSSTRLDLGAAQPRKTSSSSTTTTATETSEHSNSFQRLQRRLASHTARLARSSTIETPSSRRRPEHLRGSLRRRWSHFRFESEPPRCKRGEQKRRAHHLSSLSGYERCPWSGVCLSFLLSFSLSLSPSLPLRWAARKRPGPGLRPHLGAERASAGGAYRSSHRSTTTQRARA